MNISYLIIVNFVLLILFVIGVVILITKLRQTNCYFDLAKDTGKFSEFFVNFSNTSNIGLTATSIKCYIGTTDSKYYYLIIPAQQNSFSYISYLNTVLPKKLISDFSTDLANFTIYNPSGITFGNFNNCGINDLSSWDLNNGILSVTPYRGVNPEPININCLPSGQTVTVGFSATVIPLLKLNYNLL